MHKGIHMLEQILCDGDGTCMYMNVCKKEKYAKIERKDVNQSIANAGGRYE